MPRMSTTTKAYNAIFQEHTNPGRVITGRKQKSKAFDIGISCHVFALASPTTWEMAHAINQRYENIGTAKELQRWQDKFEHDFREEDRKALNPDYIVKPFPELTKVELKAEREENMREIQEVRSLQETVLPVENMYLVGGFREGKSTPEHMWIEDHTNNISYDTFINRGGIAVVEAVGKDGQPFKPGCEGSAFKKDEIHRVKTDGYTWGQLIAIAAGSEKKEGFPNSIINTPQVRAAIKMVKLVNDALDKIPEPNLTQNEKNVLVKVDNEQATKTTPEDIKKVLQDLGPDEKNDYQSALSKIEEVARQQRQVAREIVGRGYNPAFELITKCDGIKPQQITKSLTINEATKCKNDLLKELRNIELRQDSLPDEDRQKLQKIINEKRQQINDKFSEKEKISNTVQQIRTATVKYLDWSRENAQGFRFSHLYHGSYGREQAEKIINLIATDAPIHDILQATTSTIETSGTNEHSFSRFLHDEIKAARPEDKLVGKDSLTEKCKQYKQQIHSHMQTVTSTERESIKPEI